MKKTWLVAMATYFRRVRTGSFLLMTFGLPAIMVLSGLVPFLLFEWGDDSGVVGYVNESSLDGRLGEEVPVHVGDTTIAFVPFADQDAATAALSAETISGYLVVPADYLDGGQPVYYAPEEPSNDLEAAQRRFLRQMLLPDGPEWLLDRLASPAHVTYVGRTAGAEVPDGPLLIVRIVFPAALALIFALAVLTSASQMGSAVVREKEQRSMEIIITSLSPWQLVSGKILGMALLSLSQLSVWLAGGGVAAALLLAGSAGIGSWQPPWDAVFWAVMLGVPTYFLYAVLAAGLGIVAGNNTQAQQLAGILGLFSMAPLWLIGVILGRADGAMAVALTLFPLTSPIVGLFRMILTDVPVWQLATAFVLIVASLIASIWAVTRVFRAAMLLYGQTLRPRQLWQALRTAG